MNLEEARALGLKGKTSKRIGRGIGSGHGKTSGRGHKGAHSRSGWSTRAGWEGGQMPLFRRLPKRGFNNKIFATNYTVINVEDLSDFAEGEVVNLKSVLQHGRVSKEKHTELFKILGNGEIDHKLTVQVDAISKSARAKIEAAGGSVEILPRKVHRPKFVKKGESAEGAAKKAPKKAPKKAAVEEAKNPSDDS